MNRNVEKSLHDALWKGERLGFRFTVSSTLQVVDGAYVVLDPMNPTCHPLESVLLGEDAVSDRWETDVARLLAVPGEWVDGFCAGWNAAEIGGGCGPYEAGFVCGVDTRKRLDQLCVEGER
jgi:hypothetical protein